MKYKHLIPLTAALAIFSFLLCYSTFSADNVKSKYWENGKPRESEKYNDEGNVTEKAYYRQDGSMEQHKRYDNFGHKTEESYYNKKGKLRRGVDGWAAMRWKYKDGNLREETYYGENGQLKERKTYNASGDLIAKQYVGDDINPSEEFNPVPPITGSETVEYYDSDGKPEGSTTVSRDVWPYY